MRNPLFDRSFGALQIGARPTALDRTFKLLRPRPCSAATGLLTLSQLIRSRRHRFFGTIGLRGPLGREPTRQEADLIRDRNFRQSRRRDFDDDGYDPHLRGDFGPSPRFSQPPRFEAPSGPPVRAVVKWFKPERGFGFVELSDGSGDAFLHASVLERNGITAVQPGETLEIRVAPGQ
jgi:cold shock CspA family protein